MILRRFTSVFAVAGLLALAACDQAPQPGSDAPDPVPDAAGGVTETLGDPDAPGVELTDDPAEAVLPEQVPPAEGEPAPLPTTDVEMQQRLDAETEAAQERAAEIFEEVTGETDESVPTPSP